MLTLFLDVFCLNAISQFEIKKNILPNTIIIIIVIININHNMNSAYVLFIMSIFVLNVILITMSV